MRRKLDRGDVLAGIETIVEIYGIEASELVTLLELTPTDLMRKFPDKFVKHRTKFLGYEDEDE
jgi:hypothetical protein